MGRNSPTLQILVVFIIIITQMDTSRLGALETYFLRQSYLPFELDLTKVLKCAFRVDVFSFRLRCKCLQRHYILPVCPTLSGYGVDRFYFEIGKEIFPDVIFKSINPLEVQCNTVIVQRKWIPTSAFVGRFNDVTEKLNELQESGVSKKELASKFSSFFNLFGQRPEIKSKFQFPQVHWTVKNMTNGILSAPETIELLQSIGANCTNEREKSLKLQEHHKKLVTKNKRKGLDILFASIGLPGSMEHASNDDVSILVCANNRQSSSFTIQERAESIVNRLRGICRISESKSENNEEIFTFVIFDFNMEDYEVAKQEVNDEVRILTSERIVHTPTFKPFNLPKIQLNLPRRSERISDYQTNE